MNNVKENTTEAFRVRRLDDREHLAAFLADGPLDRAPMYATTGNPDGAANGPEWLTLQEANELTGGRVAWGSRLLVDGQEATLTPDPLTGTMVAAQITGTPHVVLNLGAHHVLIHRTAVEHTRNAQAEGDQ